MIAVDTNILVYAHRRDSPWHEAAGDCLRRLAQGRAAWGIAWPCIHEFLSIVTHPRIYRPPSTIAASTDQIDAWLASPRVELLGETDDHWDTLKAQLRSGQIVGPMVHDARVAAICIAHGVSELLTADRDFNRMSGLTTTNPLIG